jgi:hypothetical protein
MERLLRPGLGARQRQCIDEMVFKVWTELSNKRQAMFLEKGQEMGLLREFRNSL